MRAETPGCEGGRGTPHAIFHVRQLEHCVILSKEPERRRVSRSAARAERASSPVSAANAGTEAWTCVTRLRKPKAGR